MQIELAFGKSGLTVDLPEGPDWQVLEPRTASPLANVDAALKHALDHPIGTPPVAELARDKRTAAISVCDITRPAPNATTLPPLLERLHAGGIPRESVTILIATGLHRPASAAEVEAIVGQRIAAEYRVLNHYARDLESHAALGQTQRGTPVLIQKEFIEADLHITLGFIEQHLMAGFSGGRKLVAPGLAAQETIKVLHSPAFMREPLAIEGSIESNPLHAELIEIARMARHDFMLDVVLTPAREIAGVFAGAGEEAYAAGVRFVRQAMMERPAAARRCRAYHRRRLPAGPDLLPDGEGGDGGAAPGKARRADPDDGRVRGRCWSQGVRGPREARNQPGSLPGRDGAHAG